MSPARSRTRWLSREPDPSARVSLFCLPVSGVGATVFRPWPARLGDIDVLPVQLPGRENRVREPAYRTMAEFAEDAADALEPYLDRPYAFFGHCFGARLAYGLAVELTDRGTAAPERLFASSCLAPHRGGHFGGGRSGPFTAETTDEEYFEELRHGCKVRGEPEPPAELLAMSVRVLRADTELTCGYAPPGPGATPLDMTTICWTEDEHVRPAQMAEWEAYGRVRQVVLHGDDYTHRSAPEELIRVLSDGLGS